MLSVSQPHTIKHGLCESPRLLVLHRHMHVCELFLYTGGHDGLGWPELVRCDRRKHNRGIFSLTLAKNGVMIRLARLETPEHIGRVERRGDMLKKMMPEIIKHTHASSREQMDIIVSECLNAANEMTRHGGFAPAQWALSRPPRSSATVAEEKMNACSTSTC